MPGHRLGGADQHLVGVIAKGALDGRGLQLVAQRSGGAVGVDVADLLGGNPGIAVGFAIIWALAWRRQHAGFASTEDRDGVCFYVMRTSPIEPIVLQRTPGFKALRPEPTNGAVT